MARGAFLASMIAASVALLTGCYGSTEPATQVKSTSAVLIAYGTTDRGPASVSFEYWPTGRPGERHSTQPRQIPGGVTGPFSQPVDDLEPGTAYSFRLCGTDSGGTACAQTRRFDTPPRDRVHGTASASAFTVTIRVSSGPTGADVQGIVDVTNSQGQRLLATPTCLIVDGRTAIVGFQGAIQIAPDLSQPVLATAKIVDGDVAGQDSFNVDPGDTNCDTYQPGASTAYGDIDVVDSGA
jgi:hypothetical protein